MNIKRKMDIFFFSLMIFSAAALGADHEQNILRAEIVVVSFIYALTRYIFSKGLVFPSNFKLSTLLWLISFLGLYFFYGNFYYANKSTFGGNDTAGILLLYIIASTIFLHNWDINDIWHYMEKVYCTALILYLSYIMWIFSNLSLIELAGFYRIGDPIEGTHLINGNSNNIAIYLCVFMAPLIYDVLCNRNKTYIIPVLIGVIITLFTGSKKGFFTLIIYLLFFAFGMKQRFLKTAMVIMFFGSMLIVLVSTNETLNLIIGQRLFDFIAVLFISDSSVNSTSTDLRVLMYEVGIRLWLDYPFLGGGLGCFSEYSGFGVYAHNNYIELLTSFGILGVLIYYLYQLFIILKILNLKSRKCLLFLCILIVSMFLDSAAVRFYDGVNWTNLLFAIFCVTRIINEAPKKLPA